MSAVPEHRSKHCLRHAAFGMLGSVILVLVTFLVEHAPIGRDGQNLAYKWLISVLPAISEDPLPWVVDIHKIAGDEEAPTSRRRLRELLTAIARRRPRA